jgi:hypothetical protein
VCKQRRTISRLKSRKIDARSMVRKELLKTHSKAVVNHLMGKKVRPANWTGEEIIRALLLRSVSMRSYKFIRRQNIFPLPGITTLRRWIKDFHCECGMQTDSLRGEQKKRYFSAQLFAARHGCCNVYFGALHRLRGRLHVRF